jgi:hypothetical protein
VEERVALMKADAEAKEKATAQFRCPLHAVLRSKRASK